MIISFFADIPDDIPHRKIIYNYFLFQNIKNALGDLKGRVIPLTAKQVPLGKLEVRVSRIEVQKPFWELSHFLRWTFSIVSFII